MVSPGRALLTASRCSGVSSDSNVTLSSCPIGVRPRTQSHSSLGNTRGSHRQPMLRFVIWLRTVSTS